MPTSRPTKSKKKKRAPMTLLPVRAKRPRPKLAGRFDLSVDPAEVARDITELKQREASFRLLFDSNPVPMIVCAPEGGRILSVNEAAIEHYGYTRAEFEKLTTHSLQ